MTAASPQKPYSKIKYFFLSYLVHVIVVVWYFFVKKKALVIPPASQALIEKGGGFIVAVYHETTLSLYRHATQFLQKKKKATMVALVSQSKDGEIIHQTFARSKLRSVRGSSTRGGTGAFRAILKEMKQKHVPIFTVDGPKGPRKEVKPGVIVTASLTGAPILFLDARYDRHYQFRSWDRHFFPKFAAKLYIQYGEPFFVPSNLKEAEIDKWAKKLEEKMEQNRNRLEEFVRENHPNNSIDTML
jgi:lysophospholipid acyltransferase (LPLAT)-like uncharacterized protein